MKIETREKFPNFVGFVSGVDLKKELTLELVKKIDEAINKLYSKEFLLKSGNDLSINNIMITAVDKVDKILRDKTIDEIDIKNVCEITTRQTNKRYGIQQTIYACMWIPFPEVAKFSFLREVSGINFGRTIQIQFVKNNRQYVITGTSADTKQSITRMRKDVTSLVESIKFTNDN